LKGLTLPEAFRDDYRYRFEAEAKRRFIEMLRDRFNSGVAYRGRVLKWDTIIEHKVNDLGRFLVGKSSALEFTEPIPQLEEVDDREIRAKILALTASEAKGRGIGKSTLHYLRRNASNNNVHVYHKTRARLKAKSGDGTCRVKSAATN
jgi:hypothetical protein